LDATRTIYARLIPSDMARQEDISLEKWPQWRGAGHASDYFGFDKALLGIPWRWTFRQHGDVVEIVPDAVPSTTILGLQISLPFAHEPLMELHPYLGGWVAPRSYIERNPPQYPVQPEDAWGWLLPTAPWSFNMEGYRFRSVWEYAVNPILRGRSAQPESILERLVRATEHRLAVDDAWRCRAQNHGDVVRLLAGEITIDERRHLYFLALSKILEQKSKSI
jgi:hypothetical protein